MTNHRKADFTEGSPKETGAEDNISPGLFYNNAGQSSTSDQDQGGLAGAIWELSKNETAL